MQVKTILSALEVFAPPIYQESYDNSGLQVGSMEQEIKGILLSLDLTEAILEEAMQRNCNMIVAHHPLIFSGLKRIAGRTYVERVVQKAIKNDICIYAAHTNLDNMRHGVNAKIAQKLGLERTSILSPMPGLLSKLYTYAPLDAADKVRDALFAAGAGDIGKYSECSFNTKGRGSFRPGADADPAIGEAGGSRETLEEVKIEVLVPKHAQGKILRALFDSHPYEEVAYELIAMQNTNQDIGAGMIGYFPEAMEEMDFLRHLKARMKTDCVKYTALSGKKVQKVAICGGSGSFLLKDAIAAGANAFITGDFKYHQFFDADGEIIICDIGHYESEQFTPEIFKEILNEKFPNFAVLLSNLVTNPVKYI